jgi:hypothetical protein
VVAASSRKTTENVASRRGSGRYCRKASRARALSLSLDFEFSHEFAIPKIFLPKKAAHDILQQSCCLLLHELQDHVAKHCSNSRETLVSDAYIGKALIIEENLLDDEGCYCLAELRARFHNSKAQRDNFGHEKEVDDIRRVVLDKSFDNTKRSQSEIFERSGRWPSVEEGVEK